VFGLPEGRLPRQRRRAHSQRRDRAGDGDYTATIAYLDGSDTDRQLQVSADGGAAQTISFTPTGSFHTLGTTTVVLHLTAGTNTITFATPTADGPDLDRILVSGSPL